MTLEANVDFSQYPDRIAETFANKTILITGGTGFVGKVLVEKILRACSDVKKIILLIRNKKNKSANDRLKVLLNDNVSILIIPNKFLLSLWYFKTYYNKF